MNIHRTACFAFLLACGLLGWSTPAQAQLLLRDRNQTTSQPAAPSTSGSQFTTPSLALPAVTPELWVYSQEQRRHDDPAQAVRRKAEYRTAARMQRIEAMKWFGFSNARPTVSVTPTMGSYSPAWVGNGSDRYDWAGVGWPQTAVRVESYELRR